MWCQFLGYSFTTESKTVNSNSKYRIRRRKKTKTNEEDEKHFSRAVCGQPMMNEYLTREGSLMDISSWGSQKQEQLDSLWLHGYIYDVFFSNMELVCENSPPPNFPIQFTVLGFPGVSPSSCTSGGLLLVQTGSGEPVAAAGGSAHPLLCMPCANW